MNTNGILYFAFPCVIVSLILYALSLFLALRAQHGCQTAEQKKRALIWRERALYFEKAWRFLIVLTAVLWMNACWNNAFKKKSEQKASDSSHLKVSASSVSHETVLPWLSKYPDETEQQEHQTLSRAHDSGQDYVLENDLVCLRFSSQGGKILQASLKEHAHTPQGEAPLPLCFFNTINSGWELSCDSHVLLTDQLSFHPEQDAPLGTLILKAEWSFVARHGQTHAFTFRKIWSLPSDSYQPRLELRWDHDRQGQSSCVGEMEDPIWLSEYAMIEIPKEFSPTQKESMRLGEFDHELKRAFYCGENKVVRKDPLLAPIPNSIEYFDGLREGWIAVYGKPFLAAIVQNHADSGQRDFRLFQISSSFSPGSVLGMQTDPYSVQDLHTGKTDFHFFFGPMQASLLSGVSKKLEATLYENFIMAMLQPFCLYVLSYFYRMTSNWGWALFWLGFLSRMVFEIPSLFSLIRRWRNQQKKIFTAEELKVTSVHSESNPRNLFASFLNPTLQFLVLNPLICSAILLRHQHFWGPFISISSRSSDSWLGFLAIIFVLLIQSLLPATSPLAKQGKQVGTNDCSALKILQIFSAAIFTLLQYYYFKGASLWFLIPLFFILSWGLSPLFSPGMYFLHGLFKTRCPTPCPPKIQIVFGILLNIFLLSLFRGFKVGLLVVLCGSRLADLCAFALHR